MPRLVQSWLRNWLAVMVLYFSVGGLWVYYIYWCFGQTLFGEGNMPDASDVFEQMKVPSPKHLIVNLHDRVLPLGERTLLFYVLKYASKPVATTNLRGHSNGQPLCEEEHNADHYMQRSVTSLICGNSGGPVP